MTIFETAGKRISGRIRQVFGTGLAAKSAQGVMTLGGGMVAGKGLKTLRYMILARILAPEEFGPMAIVATMAMFFEAFTDIGIKTSVIQNKRGAEPEYLNAAWWIQAIRGLGLFIIAFLVAPLISSFYERPELLRLLQVSFLGILFTGLISPRAHLFEREYQFGRVVLLRLCSAVSGTIVMIVLAFVMRNVWALVLGLVTEAAVFCVLSHILVPFLPRFSIDRRCLRELLKFARGLFGSPLLAWISFKADILVLGKLVADAQLGMYSLAVRLFYLPVDLFARTIRPVLLPGFAQKQDDKKELCRAVLRVTRATAVFVLPLVVFMVCCASGILLVAYGRKYVAVTFPFAILCLQILTGTEGSILGTMYMAIGQPHLHRRFVMFRTAIIVALIYPGIIYFGLLGAASVMALGNFAAYLGQIYWCRRVIDLRIRSYVRCYVPGLLLSLPVVMTIGILLILGVESYILILVAGTVAFCAAVVIGIYILQRPGGFFPAKKKEDYRAKSDYLSSAETE